VLVPQVESKEQKEDVVVLGAHVALRTDEGASKWISGGADVPSPHGISRW
jgi:hypothetical protein